MSSFIKLISRVCLAGLFVLSVQIGASAAEKLSADIEAKIQALISQAVKEGDATILEDGLFDLVEDNADLAAAVASFASSNLPANLSADIMDALVVATAAGPALAAPSKAGDVSKAVETSQPAHASKLTAALQDALAGVEGLGDFETAAGGPSGFETAAGGPPTNMTLPGFASPAAVSATAENPSVASASPSG
jgi:hypothetical protein